jgi:hypothetical protein
VEWVKKRGEGAILKLSEGDKLRKSDLCLPADLDMSIRSVYIPGCTAMSLPTHGGLLYRGH